MSDSKPPFFFDQFVPGFDFLKNLAAGAQGKEAAAAKPGLSIPGLSGLSGIPGISNWVAPTLSVEEVDKRIKELRAVQFWLEQNLLALKATIQALEVQKMTLTTLQGMNLRMEDLAKAFTGAAAAPKPAAPARPEPVQAKAEPPEPREREKPKASSAEEAIGEDAAEDAKPAAGVVDPMRLWGALTQQFQEIASTALQEASQLKMPSLLAGKSEGAPAARKAAAPAKKAARKRAPAARKRAAR
jgi:hypothetical protein